MGVMAVLTVRAMEGQALPPVQVEEKKKPYAN
jgi:hypothetical protein